MTGLRDYDHDIDDDDDDDELEEDGLEDEEDFYDDDDDELEEDDFGDEEPDPRPRDRWGRFLPCDR